MPHWTVKVSSFRVQLPGQYELRMFQAFELLGNVNSTTTKSRLCGKYGNGRAGEMEQWELFSFHILYRSRFILRMPTAHVSRINKNKGFQLQ